MAATLAATDVHLLTSRMSADGDVEGFGIAVLEAAACGIPSMVTDYGGLPEAIADGRVGWMVPTGDHDAIAAQAIEVLSDRTKRDEKGASALSFVTENASWAVVGDAFEAVLTEFQGPEVVPRSVRQDTPDRAAS